MKDIISIQSTVYIRQFAASCSKYLKSLCTAYCVLMCCELAKAQTQDLLVTPEHQIVAMARPQQDGKIMLRWAVTTAKAWRKLNTYGYTLKRYTISRNKTTLPEPIETTIGVFKPEPLEAWMPIIDNNNNAAVMAQALYGEGFNIEGQDELSAIVNLAEEQEQRFTWGLYVADQDFETAQRAGLGYIDANIAPNEKYVYKIISLVPEIELNIEEGGVFIGLQDYEALPKPLDLAGVFLDGKAMLSWNYAIHNQIYNSYFVERSEDGSKFNRLNDLPLTSLNNSDKTNSKRMFYIDSITNGNTYYYRVLGKTPFGELGPVSEVVSGKGEQLLAYEPRITNKNYLDDKRIILDWEFLEEGNSHITGFELNRSDKANGKYTVLIKNIPPEARSIQYDSLQPTNYMTITAIGKNGSKRSSFPALIQPVDSIPPAKPVRFTGSVDSLGVVTLKWEPNKEEDILGYRVFKGNNKDEEYSQITVSPHRAEVFYDSVSVKSLNAKVYYQLRAVDDRYNMSEPSDILELKKPDFIKPTQPIFKSYSINNGQVHLAWANSSSEDVVKHEIYRKEQDSLDWKLVFSVDSKQLAESSKQNTAQLPTETEPTENWTDTNVKEGGNYHYTLVAVDDSLLESDPSPPLSLTIPKTSLAPGITGLDSYVDKKNGFIELFWKPYKQADVAEIAIYKGLKDQPMSLLRHVLPSVRRIVDQKLKPNNTYVYMIRAVFKDGRMSEVKMLEIKY